MSRRPTSIGSTGRIGSSNLCRRRARRRLLLSLRLAGLLQRLELRFQFADAQLGRLRHRAPDCALHHEIATRPDAHVLPDLVRVIGRAHAVPPTTLVTAAQSSPATRTDPAATKRPCPAISPLHGSRSGSDICMLPAFGTGTALPSKDDRAQHSNIAIEFVHVRTKRC